MSKIIFENAETGKTVFQLVDEMPEPTEKFEMDLGQPVTINDGEELEIELHILKDGTTVATPKAKKVP